MMYRKISLIIILFFLHHLSFGQQTGKGGVPVLSDSTSVAPVAAARSGPTVADSVVKLSPMFVTPKKAGLFSAIVPGLGQFHNKHYWKLPIIYVGVGAAIYFAQDNIKNYNAYRQEYAGRLSRNPGFESKFPVYDDNNVKARQDYYRRNLDLTVALTAVGYLLQIVDAVVFAHLKDFDISEDISLKATPVAMPRGGMGFGLVMQF